MRIARLGLALLCTTRALGAQAATPGTAPARAPTTTRNVLVRIVTAAEGAPLGYATVAAPALGIERFTGAAGSVVIQVPQSGGLSLVVKRLGFTAKDTMVFVTDAVSQTVHIALARVTYRLQAVRVIAWPPCRNPGVSRNADPDLRELVAQLRENAERFRLLTRTYPFVYAMQREFGERGASGTITVEQSDEILVNSTPAWTYRPGTLVARERLGPVTARTEWVMHVPSIGDLAEHSFVNNHCFHIAGLEQKEGQPLLRIDIIAAERLRDADVNVVTWLDPNDFRLRYATFTLTRAPRQVRGFVGLTSSVTYTEVIPFVPIIERTTAENTIRSGRDGLARRVLTERQRLVRVVYRGAHPDSLLVVPPGPNGPPGVK